MVSTGNIDTFSMDPLPVDSTKAETLCQSVFPRLVSGAGFRFSGLPAELRNPVASSGDFTSVLDILDSATQIVGDIGPPQIEPTPLGPRGVQEVVHKVPLVPNQWNADSSLVDVLQPLMQDIPPLDGLGQQSRKRPASTCSESTNDSSKRFRRYQSDQWADRFEELEKFRETHGNCNVPHTYPENQQLAQWVKRQRYQFKLKQSGRGSTLSDERQSMLEEIGFVWDSHKAAWDEKFQVLLLFFTSNGHTNVPSNYSDKTLAVWIKCQRRQYKLYTKGLKSTITRERIAMMDSIGFVWNPRNL